MDKRVLYIVLSVQLVFAASLLYIGHRSREDRRTAYLDLTYRATSGSATKQDFEKLAGLLPKVADKPVVRALLGVPVLTAERIEFADGKHETGEFWIYYFQAPNGAGEPITDARAASKLSGTVECFVVSFDSYGNATGRVASVIHPVK